MLLLRICYLLTFLSVHSVADIIAGFECGKTFFELDKTLKLLQSVCRNPPKDDLRVRPSEKQRKLFKLPPNYLVYLHPIVPDGPQTEGSPTNYLLYDEYCRGNGIAAILDKKKMRRCKRVSPPPKKLAGLELQNFLSARAIRCGDRDLKTSDMLNSLRTCVKLKSKYLQPTLFPQKFHFFLNTKGPNSHWLWPIQLDSRLPGQEPFRYFAVVHDDCSLNSVVELRRENIAKCSLIKVDAATSQQEETSSRQNPTSWEQKVSSERMETEFLLSHVLSENGPLNLELNLALPKGNSLSGGSRNWKNNDPGSSLGSNRYKPYRQKN